MWKKLTKESPDTSILGKGAVVNTKRWLYFITWVTPLFLGVALGSWGVLVRVSLASAVFNVLLATPLKNLLDEDWRRLLLFAASTVAFVVIIPFNFLRTSFYPIMRTFGILWLCCESAIVIDIAHYAHYRIVSRANVDHRLHGWKGAMRWYGLHMILSLVLFVLVGVIFLVNNRKFGEMTPAINWVDDFALSFLTILNLVSIFTDVNKGALIPSIVFAYAGMQCWGIRVSLVGQADDEGFLVTYHFILMTITILFGVVQEMSPTLRIWMTTIMTSSMSPRCCGYLGDYGLLAMDDSTKRAYENISTIEDGPNSDAQDLERSAVLDEDSAVAATATDLVNKSDCEVSPLFHLLLGIASCSAMMVGDSLTDSVKESPMWAMMQSLALWVLILTFCFSIWRAYQHQKSVRQSRVA